MDVPAIRSPAGAGAQQMLDGFEVAYREHFSFVWRNLVRLGVPSGEAEDAVQEVFVIAYRRWETFEYRASVRTWLFAISRRVAAHHRRSTRRRWRRHEAFGRVTEPTHDGERAVAGRHAAARLQSFLDRLEPQKRDVFVLADLEGFTGKEVARSLGINANTAWSRLRAARAEFRRAFGNRAPRPRRIVVDDHGAPVGARARVWVLLVPKLSAGSAAMTVAKGAGLVSLAKTWVLGENLKFFLGTLVVGGALLGGVSSVVPRQRPARHTVATTPAAVAAAPVRSAEVAVAKGRPAPEPATAHADASPQSEPAVQLRSMTRPTPRQGPKPRARRDAPEPAVDPTVTHEAPAPQPETAPVVEAVASAADPAGRELRILHRAKGALEAGDASTALALLDRHAKRFPDGVLKRVASQVRVDTLCALGRIAEARSEIAGVDNPVTGIELRRRFRRACGPDTLAVVAAPR